jgi:hypothetical protein
MRSRSTETRSPGWRYTSRLGVGRTVALAVSGEGGKSGLHRAGCQVTPGGREPTESATEKTPPIPSSWREVRVKWCGKSAPRWWQQQRQGKPHPEQDRIGGHAALRCSAWPARCPRVGRSRRTVTYVPDEWLSPTEPGLQAGSQTPTPDPSRDPTDGSRTATPPVFASLL